MEVMSTTTSNPQYYQGAHAMDYNEDGHYDGQYDNEWYDENGQHRDGYGNNNVSSAHTRQDNDNNNNNSNANNDNNNDNNSNTHNELGLYSSSVDPDQDESYYEHTSTRQPYNNYNYSNNNRPYSDDMYNGYGQGHTNSGYNNDDYNNGARSTASFGSYGASSPPSANPTPSPTGRNGPHHHHHQNPYPGRPDGVTGHAIGLGNNSNNNSHRYTSSGELQTNNSYTFQSDNSGYASDSGLPINNNNFRSFYSHSRRPSSVSLSLSDHQYASRSMFDLSQSYIMPLFSDGKGKQNVMPRLKTIELYRKNAKKSNDPMIQFQFAQYMLQTALRAGATLSSPKSQLNLTGSGDGASTTSASGSNTSGSSLGASAARSSASSTTSSSSDLRNSLSSEQAAVSSGSASIIGTPTQSAVGSNAVIDEKVKKDLLKEAISILRKLSDKGYADAQYLLGDAYASGALGKRDLKESFSLFHLAARHGHGEAAYRAALCLEQGWGTSRDVRKAVQFLRMASSRSQPGAMLRLGMACFYGRMGLPSSTQTKQEGIKWLKLAANEANEVFPQAPYELGRIIQHGYRDIIIPDEHWALQLYVRSADLKYVPAARLLGRAYENGELGCPQDASLSIHYYTLGAQGGDPESMLALCAWYTVGAEGILPVNHEEGFEWALRAANAGYAKAQCAVGYFMERGLGCERDILRSAKYYEMAAKAGDPSAIARLRRDKSGTGQKKNKDKDCVIC